MPLIIPQLDDRTYSDILQEALTRISVHNPEWTNYNDSDPGVTLLQLFSFMTENLLYRANLIPERNRLKFLTLLGVTLTPASAAMGVVTISNDRGPLDTVTLPGNLPVTAGSLGFVTQNGLDILPVEMQAYYRQPLSAAAQQAAQQAYGQLYATFTNNPAQLNFYQTMPLNPPASAASIPSVSLTNGTDTVDGCLWLALLTRTGETARNADVLQEIRGNTITLGIMPQVDDASQTLFPGGTTAGQGQPTMQYAISTGTTDPTQQLYQNLEASEDDNPLQNLTLVQLTIPTTESIGVWDQLAPIEDGTGDYPPTIDDPTVVSRLLAWIRIRLTPNADGTPPTTVTANFSWVGINAARVTQQTLVMAEPLGAGTGEPDQTVQLANTPVVANSVQLAVNGAIWTRVDDITKAAPEVQVQDPSLAPGYTPPAPSYPSTSYEIDNESGQIQFGDGLRGMRPPYGATIVANYAYGGGSDGNVGIAAIQSSPQLPAGFSVTNPLPTWGGDDGETVTDAEQNIPSYLQNGGRAVSVTDFENIVNQTPGVELGRVEILPLFNPGQPSVSAPGAVTVMVIPDAPGAPEPDLMFLDAVCSFLDPRRLVTTEVYVRGPQYVGLYVSVGIDVVAGGDIATVREAVRQAVRNYLSPISGGPSGDGWPLAKTVDPTGILVQALQVDGVSDVRGVSMWDANLVAITQLTISGLQLPNLLQLMVTAGDPQDQSAGTTTPPTPQLISVPMLQPQC
jgi:hypothetical protein